jgi:hypothetical protein
MRMSYDDPLEMESEFDQRGSHEAVNACMPDIAGKSLSSLRKADCYLRIASSAANNMAY